MERFKYRNNSDNTFSRSLYASISEIIKDSVSYIQIESDDTFKKITPPVIFSGTGGKNFLQYYFSDKNYTVCEDEVKIEGSYDVIPRVVIKKDTLDILSPNTTSPFGIGEIIREDEEGRISKYQGTIQGIPIKYNFSVEILCNSLSEQDKIWESFTKNLYWQRRGAFLYDGVICSYNIAFPDNTEKNKTYEFRSLDVIENFIIKCSVETECYLPIVNNEVFAGTIIRKFETTFSTKDAESELLETEYTGSIQGRILYLDGTPYSQTIKLKNLYGSEQYLETAVGEDGYFLFVNVPSKMGYMITDDEDNVLRRAIHLLPDEIKDVYIEIEN